MTFTVHIVTNTPIQEVHVENKHNKHKHRKRDKHKTEVGRSLYMQVSISVNVKCTLQSSIKIEL